LGFLGLIIKEKEKPQFQHKAAIEVVKKVMSKA
jgi:hypothetical protein